MIKKPLTLLLICITFTNYSQKKLISFENILKSSSSNIKDVIPIVNKKNNDIAFFITDAKNVYGYKLNSSFEIIDKIKSEEKSRKYKVLIGSSITGNDSYHVFLTDKKKKNFFTINFSFLDKKVSTSQFKLQSNEEFIQTVNHNNDFYLISVSSKTNSLYIRGFDEFGAPKINRIDLSKTLFIDNYSRGKSFISFIKGTGILDGKSSIKKIEENTPNSIEVVADLKKMYVKDGNVLFTLDHNKTSTQILQISLKTFEAKSFSIKKSQLANIKASNSYINGDTFFTITVTADKFQIEILDFNTGELIKKYSTLKDQLITYKNTPIIQEGGMYSGYRELGKTNRFIRRLKNEKIGISARKIDGKYHLTIGSYKTQNYSGGMMMGGFGGIPLGSLGGVNVFFNPTSFAYNSFGNTKATRIESLFDEDFNHITGDIEDNPFDKMSEVNFTDNQGSTVFKYKDYFIKTSYHTFSKKFSFFEFKD